MAPMWAKKFKTFLKLDPSHDQRRRAASKEILDLLVAYLKPRPHIRFNQALHAFDIAPVDFNEEPWKTLERMKSSSAYRELKQ